MNDLERDLTELFETKAGGLDTTPLAPPAVLRRGRRRQVGTVVGGALMAVAAAAAVIGGAAAFLGDRASEPPIMGDREVLPARTATIGGVTVTAPEGWSLLDQWPLGMNVPTETCSTSFGSVGEDVTATGGATFEATGSPIPAGDAGTSEPTPAGEDDCTPIEALPGGSPLFTLGNVAPQPVATLCPVFEEFRTQAVGPTDVFLYVGFDANADAPAWPVDLGEPTEGACGAASIVRWSVDDADYLAAAVVGPEASDEDRAALAAAFAGLRFGPPQITASPVLGYVVGAGTEGGIPWRLAAGPALTCESGDACAIQLALVTTDPDGSEQAWPVTPPKSGSSIESASQPVGQVTIAYGTAAADVVAVEIVTGDGTTVTPTSVPWPSTLEALASPEAPVDGTIWWATVPDVVSVRPVLEEAATDPSGSPTGTPSAGETTSIADLRLDTTRDGDEWVATGEDLGTTWEARTGTGHIVFVQGGAEPLNLSVPIAGGTMDDAPGGSFLLWLDEPSAGPPTVVVDGTGEALVGRWMPAIEQLGKDARLWIVALPGSGSGLRFTSPDDHLPMAESWPTSRAPGPGVVASAGTNGVDDISWKLAYTDADCLVLAEVAGDGSIGQTGCLDPSGSQTSVMHAHGDERSMIAVVIPDADANGISATSPDVESPYGQCTTPARDPVWEGQSICVITIPNDVEIPLRITAWDPDAMDDVVIDRWVVRVSDGQLVAEQRA